MRIIIESNEKEQLVSPVHASTESAPMEAMDGGPPSETLIQAIAQTLPVATDSVEEQGGASAGPPPEWLVNAIPGAASPVQAILESTDAGAAPR